MVSVVGGFKRIRLSAWKIGLVFNQPLWDHAGRRHLIIPAGLKCELHNIREVMNLHDSVCNLSLEISLLTPLSGF